jgi:hypothetical protein
MYPKPVQDLSGWDVRSLACNTKVCIFFLYVSALLEHSLKKIYTQICRNLKFRTRVPVPLPMLIAVPVSIKMCTSALPVCFFN